MEHEQNATAAQRKETKDESEPRNQGNKDDDKEQKDRGGGGDIDVHKTLGTGLLQLLAQQLSALLLELHNLKAFKV